MHSRLFYILTALATAALAQTSAVAKSYDAGTEAAADYIDAQAIAAPHPNIPEHMREQCFKSCCIARFMINPDGTSKVKLLSSSGCDEIDDITVSTLRQWKFKPAMLDGKPVPSTRRVKVEFEID